MLQIINVYMIGILTLQTVYPSFFRFIAHLSNFNFSYKHRET